MCLPVYCMNFFNTIVFILIIYRCIVHTHTLTHQCTSTFKIFIWCNHISSCIYFLFHRILFIQDFMMIFKHLFNFYIQYTKFLICVFLITILSNKINISAYYFASMIIITPKVSE